jgi:maltooligosyltrehalose trehalohydrolase
MRSKLDHSLRGKEPHQTLLQFYKELIRLRRACPPLADLGTENKQVMTHGSAIVVRRASAGKQALTGFNFGEASTRIRVPLTEGRWRVALDSSDQCWRGPGGLSGVLNSPGELDLELNPIACLLLLKEA